MIDFRIPILVLDQDASTRKALCDMLQDIGFPNVTEDDGSHALALLREHGFGLVLADMFMAQPSGFELLCAIRQAPSLAHILFIMTTGIVESSWVQAAREAGADAYLVKPFDADRLRSVVLGTLARAQSPALVAGGTARGAAESSQVESTAETRISDDRPMMPIHENGVELYRRYGHLAPGPECQFSPWQMALMEWWKFMHRRETLVAVRRRRHAAR